MNRNSSFLDEIASDLTRNQLAGHNTAACVGHKSKVDFNMYFLPPIDIDMVSFN